MDSAAITPDVQLGDQVYQFIENLSIVLAESGMTRMGGRIMAAVICFPDPNGPTQADLAKIINASPAAISTTTRELISSGHLKKVSLPRERSDRYQNTDVVAATIENVVNQNQQISQAYRAGLALFPEDSHSYQTIKRNMDFHHQFATMAAAIPQMFSHKQ